MEEEEWEKWQNELAQREKHLRYKVEFQMDNLDELLNELNNKEIEIYFK